MVTTHPQFPFKQGVHYQFLIPAGFFDGLIVENNVENDYLIIEHPEHGTAHIYRSHIQAVAEIKDK